MLMHGMALGILWFVILPGYLFLLLGAGLLGSLTFYSLRDVLGLLPVSWRSLAWQDGQLIVTQRNGQQIPGLPVRETVVCRHFVVLGLRTETTRLTCWRVIFPDALDPEEFRRLSVGLKFAPVAQGERIVGMASGNVSG